MVDEEDMQELYQWIDDIPLSRPKKNINRDFSDGGVCAGRWAHTGELLLLQCSRQS